MRKVIAAVLFTAGMATTAVAADFENQLKARQSLMQIYKFNISMLGMMAKGVMPYDAKLAQNSADNLLAAASMKNGAMWPMGSDAGAPGLKDKTRAKPEIWTTYPKIAEKGKALGEAAATMAGEAGKGLDAVRANMKGLGEACKGCHEDFRVPEKK